MKNYFKLLGFFVLSLTSFWQASAQITNFGMVLSTTDETCTGNGEIIISISNTQAGSQFRFEVYRIDNLITPIYEVDGLTATSTTFVHTATAINSGDYTVKTTQTFGTETNNLSNNVSVSSAIQPIVFTTTEEAICGGLRITANVTSGHPNTYELLDENDNVVVGHQTSNVLDFTPSSNGIYRVRVTDTCGEATVFEFTINESSEYTVIRSGSDDLFYKMTDCNTIHHREKLRYNGSATIPDFKFPIQVQIEIENPTGGANTIYNTTWTSNADNEELIDVPYYEGEAYSYKVTFTDACGQTFSKTDTANTLTKTRIQTLAALCGTKYVVFSLFNHHYASATNPLTLTFTQYPSGFDPADYNSDFTAGTYTHNYYQTDISTNYNISFGSAVTTGLPEGTYTVEFTSCSKTETRTFTIANDITYLLNTFRHYGGCGDNEGSISLYIRSNISSLQSDNLVSLDITNGPSEFVANYGNFPYDVSANIGTDGRFYMNSLPAGNYEVRAVGDCGQPITGAFTIYDKSINAAITPTLKCGSFDLTASITSYLGNEMMYLQKYYPASGRWGHPTTGVLYTEGINISVSTGLRLNSSTNNNSGLQTISGSVTNLTETGVFRVVVQYREFQNGSIATNASIYCRDVLGTFNVPSTGILLNNYHVFQCATDGTAVLTIDAEGVAPLSYQIVAVDGVATTTYSATTEPIFTGLGAATYTVQVEDGCGNTKLFDFVTTTLKTPILKPDNLCEGENGSLTVQGSSYLNIRWYKDGIDTGITSRTYEFSPYDENTDLGVYEAVLTHPNAAITCPNQTLSITVTTPLTPVEAGMGQTVNVLQQNTAVMNLFDYISGDYDDWGDWEDLSNTGVLSNEVLDATQLAIGTYQFKYTVTGYCSGSDTTIVTINIKTTDLTAVEDTFSLCQIAGQTGVGNVMDNDTENSMLVTQANYTISTEIADPNGIISVNADGTVDVASGAVVGQTYSLTYRIEAVANANNYATGVVTLELYPLPIFTDSYTQVCIGNTITLIGSGTASLTGYTSSDETVATIDVISGELIGVSPGTTMVAYTNSNNCTVTKTITVNPLPAIPTISQVVQPTCNTPTGSIVLTDLPSGNWTITYNSTTLTGVGSTYTLTGLTHSTTYQFTVENANGCTSSATTTISIGNYICATDDSITTSSGATTTQTVIANDTLNGTPVSIGTNPGEVAITTVTATTGVILNPDGTVTVAPTAASGTYTIVYEICENGANPSNCDTATVTIVVDNLIDAVDDSITTSSGATTTQTVIANDTLNGTPVSIGTNPGEVAITTVTATTGVILNPDGTVTVAPTAASGTYTIVYEICENGANPSNCDTATVTIVVDNLIDAVDDSITTSSGATTTQTVIANDTLNGTPVSIGTNPGEVAITTVTATTGVILNPDGTVTVAPTAASGTYTIVYEICENGANPSNCDTATVTIVVDNLIDAVDDSITTSSGATTTQTVIANDTLNGTPVSIGTNPGEVAITTVTATTGVILNPDGTVTVAPTAASGTYTIVYEICENGANPSNCDTATVTIVVDNLIDAVDDSITTSSGATTTQTVIANDTLNGTPVSIGTNPGEVAITTVTATTGVILNPDGTVTVAPTAASGTYTIVYEICENGANPSNCDTATVTIVVDNLIDAVDDSITTSSGATTTQTVIANDTLNGTPVSIGTNPGEVAITTVTATTGVILNPDGTVTVAPTAASGTYTIVYEICENGANPSNCDTATVTIVVDNLIDAVDDSITTSSGATTTQTVIANDTLNGTPVSIGTNPGEVAITTVTATTGVILNPDGTVTVAPTAASGTYTIVYEICENGANPSNCDTATVTIVVDNLIDAVDDSITTSSGATTTQTVIANDTLNGTPVSIGTNPGEVAITTVTATTGVILNPDGTVTVAPTAASGTYTIVYEICENGANPSNCDTATVTIVVDNLIDAVDDSITTSSGATTTQTVIANDTLNGTPVSIGTNPGEVAITTVTATTGVILNPDGTVTVAPTAASGTYTIVYEICENGANPSNCDTATVTIVVDNLIDAVDDSITTSSGATTTQTVIANDTLNGTPVSIGTNPGEVAITTVTATTGVILNPDGTVTVAPTAASGTYTIVYEICENGANPSNCDTATVTIVVDNLIDAVDDSITASSGATTTQTVIANDTLNGTPVSIGTNPGEVAITTVTATTGVILNPDGTVTVAPTAASGTYTIVYEICENGANPSNCDTATVIVVVTSSSTTVVIDAVDDDFSSNPVSPANGGTVGNVLANDTLNGTPITNPSDVAITLDDDGGIGTTIDSNGNVTVPANTTAGIYTLTYTICDVTDTQCDTAMIIVAVESGCELIFYNGMSTNEDGMNDVFVIDGIICYPNNTVKIYNRWGVKVFEVSGYNNTANAFRGLSNGRVTIDTPEKLPQGTYYYILEYVDANNNTQSKAGWLYIKNK